MDNRSTADAWEALERYKKLVDDLPCECDDYVGYHCSIHSHRRVARAGLKGMSKLLQELDSEARTSKRSIEGS